MGWSTLPKPGKTWKNPATEEISEIGPCVEPCQHTDCAQTRSMAKAECPFCNQPIGYDRKFYNVRANKEFEKYESNVRSPNFHDDEKSRGTGQAWEMLLAHAECVWQWEKIEEEKQKGGSGNPSE